MGGCQLIPIPLLAACPTTNRNDSSRLLPRQVNNVGDRTPDHEFLILANLDGREVSIGSLQEELLPVFPEAFHGEVTVDHGHHNLPVGWCDGAIHDQNISGVDSRVPHGFTLHPDTVGSCLVSDQLLVEINRALKMIIRR